MPVVAEATKMQTTLRIPTELYREAKSLLSSGSVPFSTLNDLVLAALENYVQSIRRKQVDAAFALMAQDPHYARQSEILAGEFERSDWEADELVGQPDKTHEAR